MWYGTSFLCKINPTNPGCPIGGGGGGGKKANGGNGGNGGNSNGGENGGGNILAVPFANSYQNWKESSLSKFTKCQILEIVRSCHFEWNLFSFS